MNAALLTWVRTNGAPAVFLCVAIENLGVPWIAAPGYLVASEIVRSGYMDFWPMVLLISTAHVAGATFAWAVMRAGENALSRFFRRNRRLDDAHQWLCHWYARRGPLTLLGGRIVGQVRPWASLAAGMARVKALHFLLFTTIGSVAYSTAALLVWITGLRIWLWIPHLRWIIIVAAALSFFGVLGYLLVRYIVARRERRVRPEPNSAEPHDDTR